MTPEIIAGLILGGLLLVILTVTVYRRMPKKLKTNHYTDNWQELQKSCRDKSMWPHVLQEADKLLDSALKKRKFSGKTMGERMVSAQKTFSNNDTVWFAHNLAKKVAADPQVRLKENDVKNALVGFRQALRDIGALPYGESRSTK